MEQNLEGKDKVASPADQEERTVLEEKLLWTRLELQKTLAASADADETICKLAAAARGTMQERDEARSQRNALLAQLQARNAHTMMLARSRIARPDHAFTAAATSYHHGARAPAAASAPRGWMAQQHGHAGPGYRFAPPPSSSSSRSDVVHGGHRNRLLASSPSTGVPAQPAAAAACHDIASSSQDEDSFDPDMFLVDAADAPQDFVTDTARGTDVPGKSSGEHGLVAEQMLLPRRGKLAQAQDVRDDARQSIQSVAVAATGCYLADVVNAAGSSHTST